MSIVNHAWHIRIFSPTGPMNHILLYCLKEKWLHIGIRPACPDAGVNSLWSKKFMGVSKKNEKVHMRKSALLKFNNIHVGDGSTKNAMLVNII